MRSAAGSNADRRLVVHIGEEVIVEDSSSGTRTVIEPGESFEIGELSISRAAPSFPSMVRVRSPTAPKLCTADVSMQRLGELVDIVARGEISVLLLGETGAGKEVVAHAIHDRSRRAAGPFVAVNCAAVPEPLFESELFGYERGAFTGATTPKAGLLESAHGGTLFLDEVGEIPVAAQAKLLRAIELREIRRVGGTRPIPLDVRFIAATHRKLDEAIGHGRFREDLFYRLNGISLRVPPLRERPASLRVLAGEFLAEAAARLHRETPAIGPEALRILEKHSWPGNVRELRNVMERAALVCRHAVLEPRDLLVDTPRPKANVESQRAHRRELGHEIDELERSRILAALDECGGNQTLAAKRLGISRRRLLHRLDEYGVARPRKRQVAT